MQKILRTFEPIDFPPPSANDIQDAEFLKQMPDEKINFSDISDLSNFSAVHYYQTSNYVAIDDDILKIFMKSGSDYIKKINSILRNSVSVS